MTPEPAARTPVLPSCMRGHRLRWCIISARPAPANHACLTIGLAPSASSEALQPAQNAAGKLESKVWDGPCRAAAAAGPSVCCDMALGPSVRPPTGAVASGCRLRPQLTLMSHVHACMCHHWFRPAAIAETVCLQGTAVKAAINPIYWYYKACACMLPLQSCCHGHCGQSSASWCSGTPSRARRWRRVVYGQSNCMRGSG